MEVSLRGFLVYNLMRNIIHGHPFHGSKIRHFYRCVTWQWFMKWGISIFIPPLLSTKASYMGRGSVQYNNEGVAHAFALLPDVTSEEL